MNIQERVKAIVTSLRSGGSFQCVWDGYKIRVGSSSLWVDGTKFMTFERQNGRQCYGVNLSFNSTDSESVRYDILSMFFSADMVRHLLMEAVKEEENFGGERWAFVPLDGGWEKPAPKQQTIDDLWGEL